MEKELKATPKEETPKEETPKEEPKATPKEETPTEEPKEAEAIKTLREEFEKKFKEQEVRHAKEVNEFKIALHNAINTPAPEPEKTIIEKKIDELNARRFERKFL